ncbi:MAG: tetraacyldisaccharide 4'-kinase [Gammaproteobacteria bacterium]|nr:tetraacyldisaccharide 4'-kinase [Gammaproteobacteria bacterium]
MLIRQLERAWYQPKKTLLTIILLPLSWIFLALVSLRRALYRCGFFKKMTLPVPVIVVGNIVVGGTGKTPFVIALCDWLQKNGFSPGIVTRGVGGKKKLQPMQVQLQTAASEVGDEAVMLFRRTHCPVVVCVDRVAAGEYLLNHNKCNIILSDDGLQHYRLNRQFEIALLDEQRKLGNGCMLPAGPLRESQKRLNEVNLVLENGKDIQLTGYSAVSLLEPQQRQPIHFFSGKKVHALAGIGNPARFFAALRKNNVEIIEHIFPDHYLYRREDIYFPDDLPVLMTEKDAVKCEAFADQRHWFIPVDIFLNSTIDQKLANIFRLLTRATQISH